MRRGQQREARGAAEVRRGERVRSSNADGAERLSSDRGASGRAPCAELAELATGAAANPPRARKQAQRVWSSFVSDDATREKFIDLGT